MTEFRIWEVQPVVMNVNLYCIYLCLVIKLYMIINTLFIFVEMEDAVVCAAFWGAAGPVLPGVLHRPDAAQAEGEDRPGPV